MNVKIEASWMDALAVEFSKPYFEQIALHIKTEMSSGTTIYPSGSQLFNAFEQTPFNAVKVVILGQDPYHGPNQAMGLSFSVPKGIKPPPSLVNIFKELQQDVGMPIPKHGDLTHWAKQGVLLLNAALTVRANEANSHSKIGWHQFTDAVISTLSANANHVVFILWGRFAQNKLPLIDLRKHVVLQSAHPSPLSAFSGFFGCKHFSKTNELLIKAGKEPIDWNI